MAAQSKKVGRRKKSGANLRYIAEKRHDRSHLRRMRKHLMRWPTDSKTLDTYTKRKAVTGLK